jgi:hypothetical protein
MNGGFNDRWVFGYGSLIWGAGTVLIAERIEGFLDGWHREWNWISASRHGAPTCSLATSRGPTFGFKQIAPSPIWNCSERESGESLSKLFAMSLELPH